MTGIGKFLDYIKENKNRQIDIKELISNHNELFLLIPLIAFVIAPVYYLAFDVPFNLDEPFNGFFYYNYSINFVIYLSAVAGPVATVIYFWKQRRKNIRSDIRDYIPMIFFAVLCVLMVVSTCVNGVTRYTFHGDGFRGETLVSFLVYFAVMYFCGTLIKKEENKKLVIGLFLLSDFVVNAVELVNIYIKPLQFFEYSDSSSPSAIFYQFNHYGYFLMFGIMISAGIFSMCREAKYRIISAFMLIMNSFMLVLNTTFGTFLACLVGMIFLVIVSSVVNRKFSLMSLIAFGIFILVTFLAGLKYYSFLNELCAFFRDIKLVMDDVNETAVAVEGKEAVSSAADSAGTGRWGLWRLTIGYIKEKPLFGWGVEGISQKLNEESGGVNSRPHNEYLQYAAFFGIPALLAYVSGLAAHFIKALKTRKSFSPASAICLVAAFTYLVSAVFGNTMFYTAPYLFIFLGLATADRKVDKKLN